MATMMRSVIGVALGCGAMLVLHGCGGGGGDNVPATTVTTTTTLSEGPTGLYFCEEVATFYKVTYDEDGLKSASGQCLPSATPGAYYTSVGEKDSDGKSDKPWSCFSPDFSKDLWTNEEAVAHGFAGACLLKDYDSTATPEAADLCSEHLSHHPAVCSPGPWQFWGACWSSHSENWRCIPNQDATIPGLAKGDCKAQVLLEPGSSDVTDFFYDGVCRFQQDTVQYYKCDTVPGYMAGSASTCGQHVDTTDDKACFSMTSGVQWGCLPEKTGFTAPCDWTLQPGDTQNFYKGACVFPKSKAYKTALDAHNLTAVVEHQIVV